MQIDPELRGNLKKYFTFSRREYKATITLLIFTFLAWSYADVKNYFYPEKFDLEKIRVEATLLAAVSGSTDAEPVNDSSRSPVAEDPGKAREALFHFNPNTATETDWLALGLTNKQAHTIMNYLNKGGKFKTGADLKKIYGIPEKTYLQLEPFIDIPGRNEKSQESQTGHEKTARQKEVFSIELNAADSNDLDHLPGIGFGYARRILKYRAALGGYVSPMQLMEVYGFRTTLLDSILPYLRVDATKVYRININLAPLDELKKHPYIRFRLASAITNYRAQHGLFQSPEDLKKIVLINDSVYTRLLPYIGMD
jgi:competence protein ComEA